MLTLEQRQIIQHSIGCDEYGREFHKRNFFGTESTCADGKICEQLVAAGLMKWHGKSEICGGEDQYTVTEAGKRLFFSTCPKPPEPKKLTAAQRRYQDFLDADSGLPFFEWIKAKNRQRKCESTNAG